MPEPASARSRLEKALAGIPRRGTEASFKLAPGALLTARGLIGIEKRFLAADRFFGIARELGVPQSFIGLLAEEYPAANFFYFGYEDGASPALKLYVEYPVLIAPLTAMEAEGADASRPSLQARGYKWDAESHEPVAVTQYVWYVHLAAERVLERLHAICGDARAPGVELVRGIVEARRATPPHYIEASEAGNPRVSYDVNVYEHALTVGAIGREIEALGRAYGIDAAALAGVLAETRTRPLGHLSGGVGRDNRDFLTVYYET